MTKSRSPKQALDRAYTELGIVRHISKDKPLTRLEYIRVKDCCAVLGKIRSDYLDLLERQIVTGN